MSLLVPDDTLLRIEHGKKKFEEQFKSFIIWDQCYHLMTCLRPMERHCADTQHRRQILRGWVGAAVAVQEVACFIADGKV